MREDGFMKHIFIINPVAGNGIDHITFSEKIKEAVTELGIVDYEIHVTTGVGNANEFAKEKVKDYQSARFALLGEKNLSIFEKAREGIKAEEREG